jgi:hypothetical protein
MVIIFLFSMALVVAMTMCIWVLGATFLIDKIILTGMSSSNNRCLGEYSSPDIHKENNSKETDSNDKGRSSNRNCEEDEHQ